MATKAVQQFMLGTVLGSEGEARQTLAAMKEAGYDGIELCGFMIHPIGFAVKMLTKAAGMPVGKGGNLDWHKLVRDTGLQVVSLHTDLGSLERDARAVAGEAKGFGTKYVVITGMQLASGTMTNVGYDRERNAFWMVPCEYVPVSYPGTGDMYASVLIGGFLSGDSLPIAMDRATRFTELAIQTTFSYGTDTRCGVQLERVLGWLTQQTVLKGYQIL